MQKQYEEIYEDIYCGYLSNLYHLFDGAGNLTTAQQEASKTIEDYMTSTGKSLPYWLPLWPRIFFPTPLRRQKNDAILDAIAKTIKCTHNQIESINPPKRMRADAKIFLLANICQMVIHPIFDPRAINSPFKDEFTKNLEQDIKKIIEESVSSSTQDDISSHLVMKAIINNWDQITMTTIKLWDS